MLSKPVWTDTSCTLKSKRGWDHQALLSNSSWQWHSVITGCHVVLRHSAGAMKCTGRAQSVQPASGSRQRSTLSGGVRAKSSHRGQRQNEKGRV